MTKELSLDLGWDIGDEGDIEIYLLSSDDDFLITDSITVEDILDACEDDLTDADEYDEYIWRSFLVEAKALVSGIEARLDRA